MGDLEALSREELIALVRQMGQRIAELEQRVAELEKENEALRAKGAGRGKGAPDFVKANRAQRPPRGERKKRAEAFVRKRDQPTETVVHALENCPDCGRKLSGGCVKREPRQVIEIPETPIRITDHVLITRRCGVCQKEWTPKLGSEDGVIGKHRVGIRLMSWVATLSTQGQMPQETIQELLQSQYGVHLAVGEISEILHSVARRGSETVASLLEEVRKAPVVHADETGWREDGVNGYLWSFSTPTVRYYHRDASRKGQVARDILGEDFSGALVCDFYGGYNWYLGPIQRCWDHFSRDLKDLKKNHLEDAGVASWVDDVFKVFGRAKDVAARELPEPKRRQWRCQFEGELLALARPYLGDGNAPQHTLAERIERFQSELFTFVQHPGVPPGNNAAERAIRPAVTVRKVSGGTRSEKGSRTKAALMTLFGTWVLRGRDCFQACIEMLRGSPTVAPAAPT